MKEFAGRKLMSFNLQGLIKNYSVIPVVTVTFLGACAALFYCGRLLVRNPDVTLHRRKNPEPWQDYENKQYKFMSWIDHENYKHPRPRF